MRINDYLYTMKAHNGMRPQDIVVLLKIAAKGKEPWLMKDLGGELGISFSEISESLHRSAEAGLLAMDKKRLQKSALMEFLIYGLKYVYPQHPGAMVRGIATAHSAKPLSKVIVSSEPYVWPWAEGKIRGQMIQPLHPMVPAACLKDEKLYELLALVDALRVGRVREQKIAAAELEKRL